MEKAPYKMIRVQIDLLVYTTRKVIDNVLISLPVLTYQNKGFATDIFLTYQQT